MDLRESQRTDGPRHPWEVARYRFLSELLARHRRLDARRVLDVGSGDAWLASQLLARLPTGASITCCDASYTPATLARLELPSAITPVARAPRGPFDLIMLLDVLEHVEDDRGFLRDIVGANTRPGTTVLFTVPAWPALFSQHDIDLLHHRRYRPAEARARLEDAGLVVLEEGGFFHSLLAPRLLAKGLEALRGGATPRRATPSSTWQAPAVVARAAAAALRVDNAVSAALGRAGLALPGLSYYAIAHRP